MDVPVSRPQRRFAGGCGAVGSGRSMPRLPDERVHPLRQRCSVQRENVAVAMGAASRSGIVDVPVSAVSPPVSPRRASPDSARLSKPSHSRLVAFALPSWFYCGFCKPMRGHRHHQTANHSKGRTGDAHTRNEPGHSHSRGHVSLSSTAVLRMLHWMASPDLRHISARHASTPSPAGRRWREAPDEGSMPCSRFYARRTLTPTPLPVGEGLRPLRYSANQLPKSAKRGPGVLEKTKTYSFVS